MWRQSRDYKERRVDEKYHKMFVTARARCQRVETKKQTGTAHVALHRAAMFLASALNRPGWNPCKPYAKDAPVVVKRHAKDVTFVKVNDLTPLRQEFSNSAPKIFGVEYTDSTPEVNRESHPLEILKMGHQYRVGYV